MKHRSCLNGFPSPHPGIINFFFVSHSGKKFSNLSFRPLIRGLSISSKKTTEKGENMNGFRPLIRGLSISSEGIPPVAHRHQVSVPSSGDYQFLLRTASIYASHTVVSVPSSGDYQFLHKVTRHTHSPPQFPSPHPGIINFFLKGSVRATLLGVSVPSSGDYQFLPSVSSASENAIGVSVPSSGDYQFLPKCQR